jgi:hypothetical protein
MVAAAAVVLIVAAPVAAQTSGYPPGSPPSCTTQRGGNLGSAAPGGSLVANVGGCFQANTAATVVVNGTTVCHTNADGSGFVPFTVNVTSESQVNVVCGSSGDPAAAQCGSNTYVVSGTDQAGNPSSASGTFTILCASSGSSTQGESSGGGTSGLTSGNASGPDVLATQAARSPATSGSGGGALAFTGAEIAGLVLLALILLAVGTSLVMAARRRRSEQPS